MKDIKKLEEVLGKLEIEVSELDIKLDKLKTFIEDESNSSKVSTVQWELMKLQFTSMSKYSNILHNRIKFIKEDIYG